MSRLVPLLCLGCAAAIGATAWTLLRGGGADRIAVPPGAPATPASGGTPAPDPAAVALQEARRTCTVEALDRVVADLEARAAASPGDRTAWRLLAAALLDRIAQRTHLQGLVVGAPTYTELPAATVRDIDAGLAAIERARQLGDDGAELHRLEASLVGYRVTGFATALQWGKRIGDALSKAGERAQDDPQLHVALGLRKLLMPKLLGNDPGKALEHFEYAAKVLPDDERPAVFAAMASYLQKKRQQAIAWLERAVQRNPNNVFAKVVLQRVRRDEQDPFGRDVTAAEAAAAR